MWEDQGDSVRDEGWLHLGREVLHCVQRPVPGDLRHGQGEQQVKGDINWSIIICLLFIFYYFPWQDIGYRKDCSEFTETKCRTVYDTKGAWRTIDIGAIDSQIRSVPWTLALTLSVNLPKEWGEVLGLLQEAVRHGVRDRDGSRSELLLPLIIMRFIFLDYLILEYEQKCSTSYEEQCHGYGYHQSCTKVQSVWRKKNLMWIMTWWFCKNNYKVWWLVVNLYLFYAGAEGDVQASS